MVRAGTIRYDGLSNVPAWYLTRAATLAEAHGVPGPIVLQLQYALVDRSIEQEHVPAARELGLELTPWSPLAGGFLAGRYTRQGAGASGEGRLSGANPFGDTKFTDHNWPVFDVLRALAAEVNRPAGDGRS
nr:aldo/keto reductase [Deinococcus aestuarii]